MTGSSVAMTNANEPQPVETRFGTFTARPRDIVTLADGLPGFESCRRFFPAHIAGDRAAHVPVGLDDARRPSSRSTRVWSTATTGVRSTIRSGGVSAQPPMPRYLWLSIVRVTESEGSTVNLRAPLVIDPNRPQACSCCRAMMSTTPRERLE